MKKFLLLTFICSHLFSYELYKEIKIDDVDIELINQLNKLHIHLDHVHVESDYSIKFAISESIFVSLSIFSYAGVSLSKLRSAKGIILNK